MSQPVYDGLTHSVDHSIFVCEWTRFAVGESVLAPEWTDLHCRQCAGLWPPRLAGIGTGQMPGWTG